MTQPPDLVPEDMTHPDVIKLWTFLLGLQEYYSARLTFCESKAHEHDAAIEALENRLGTALPATMRVTEVVLKVEP